MADDARQPLLGQPGAALNGNGKLDGESPFAGDAGNGNTSSGDKAGAAIARKIALAIWLSLGANVLLMAAKTAAFIFSGSMAVLASAVDSVIDLLSQAVISAAGWAMARPDPRYPAGKARLEPISVLACAFIMTVGALAVVQESAAKLHGGLARGELPSLELGPLMFCVLGLATLLKLPLWWYCAALKRFSGAAEALAEDHMNDVAANLGAIVTAAVASRWQFLWWADPAGGILISAVIIWRWCVITAGSVAKVVGVEAPEDVVELVRAVVDQHLGELAQQAGSPVHSGFLRAYHAGQRSAVDVELEATILEAAVACRDLKEKLEALPEVESASVVVVPLGTHTAGAPALLLPDAVAKPPGTADLAGDAALLAESAALSRLASAYLATAPTWRPHPPPPPAPRPKEAAAAAGPSAPAPAGAPGRRPGGAGISRRMTAPPALHPAAGAPGLPAPGPAEPASGGYAQHAAWMRALRDAPSKGLSAATFRRRDTASLLSALDRRPTLLDASQAHEALAAAAAAAAATGSTHTGADMV